MKNSRRLLLLILGGVLIVVALLAIFAAPRPAPLSPTSTTTKSKATSVPVNPAQTPAPIVAVTLDTSNLPTVTPPAPDEPTLPPEALAMHAAPTVTPGLPPTLTPVPSLTPTFTPQPTSTPVEANGVDTVPMIEIPSGQFTMGVGYDDATRRTSDWVTEYSRSGESRDFANESPPLIVSLPTFTIDQLPVTNARYRACVKASICPEIERISPNLPSDYRANPKYDEYPVYGVTWYDANTYCGWVGKRLPTEAEWEKAARGTDERRYPWGDTWEESKLTPLLSSVGAHASGASPYLVQDLLKGGGEWTSDFFRPYPGNSVPTTELRDESIDRSSWRVVRGLSRYKDPSHWITTRFSVNPAYQQDVGFRCVRGQNPPPDLNNILVEAKIPTMLPPASHTDLSDMVYVPAGEFLMGYAEPFTNARGRNEHQNAMPAHIVYLDAFYIDRYEVTYAEYAQFLNLLGGHELACNGVNCAAVRPPNDSGSFENYHLLLQAGKYVADSGFERFPVGQVSWSGASAYCTWVGKRLPTEAEWEKAARGTDGRLYPWGHQWDPNEKTDTVYPREIGTQAINVSPYGAYDMLGNEVEWVADWYAEDYYTNSPLSNPTGPQSGNHRVVRSLGGASGFGLPSRDWLEPQYALNSFRCAYSPPSSH